MESSYHAGESGAGPDAFELLILDHREVARLFEEYHQLLDDGTHSTRRIELVDRVCEILAVHMLVEEGIVYPAVRTLVADDRLMDKAAVEHSRLWDKIKELQRMQADDPDFDDTVAMLHKDFNAHAALEEQRVFPRARLAGLNAAKLGVEIQWLTAELSPPSRAENPPQMQSRSAKLP